MPLGLKAVHCKIAGNTKDATAEKDQSSRYPRKRALGASATPKLTLALKSLFFRTYERILALLSMRIKPAGDLWM